MGNEFEEEVGFSWGEVQGGGSGDMEDGEGEGGLRSRFVGGEEKRNGAFWCLFLFGFGSLDTLLWEDKTLLLKAKVELTDSNLLSNISFFFILAFFLALFFF